jgi:hypothetical protein
MYNHSYEDLMKAVQQAANTADDLGLVTQTKCDSHDLDDEDRFANTMIGLEFIHRTRMARLVAMLKDMKDEGRVG